MEQSLAGKTVAIPETRQLDVFAGLLERRGARVLRCPLVGIHDTPDTESVIQWVERVVNRGLDDLILLTGEGLRRILSIINQQQPTLREPFIQQLARSRKLCRGPKPAKVLRELKLNSELSAATPTTAGVIASLSEHDLTGRRIGVQLYGSYENPPLIEFLQQAGAEVDVVAPYVYADEAEDQQVQALIAQIIAGEVDVIAFTSSPQIQRLLLVAKRQEQEDALRKALADVLVAAVGPVVRDTLTAKNIHCDLMPTDSFFLKPLVTAIADSY